MTDPVMNFSDVPDDAPVIQPEGADAAGGTTPETPRRRGRPRSPETVERDERVLALLSQSGPQTREQLVEALQLPPNMVYLSLWRLRREARVERTSTGSARHVWQVRA